MCWWCVRGRRGGSQALFFFFFFFKASIQVHQPGRACFVSRIPLPFSHRPPSSQTSVLMHLEDVFGAQGGSGRMSRRRSPSPPSPWRAGTASSSPPPSRQQPLPASAEGILVTTPMPSPFAAASVGEPFTPSQRNRGRDRRDAGNQIAVSKEIISTAPSMPQRENAAAAASLAPRPSTTDAHGRKYRWETSLPQHKRGALSQLVLSTGSPNKTGA